MPHTVDMFLDLEKRVWRGLVTGDQDADTALLAPNFLGVYPTGFATRDDHVGQLDAGPTMASFELTDARILSVDPTCVMLSYRADYRRTGASSESPLETMYISSLWTRSADRWQNVFSQDTPAAQ